MAKTVKILSCDGGGFRGLLAAKLLEALEAEIQALKPESSLADCFDFFAGTSTGSIIACGLAKGMKAKEISDFYEQKGEKIFPKMGIPFWAKEAIRRIKSLRFTLPLFSPEGLEDVLSSDNIFPDNLLFEDLAKPTLVVSYDTYNRKAVVFKSTGDKSAKVPVWQVCRASAAAPVAFPAYLLKNEQFEKEHKTGGKVEGDLPRVVPKQGIPLIDGGILANNPTLCAIAEKVRSSEISLDNILVASFGTGQVMDRIEPQEATTWGGLAWSSLANSIPLYQVCSDGSADVIDYIAESLLKTNYLRYQPVISRKASSFEADKANQVRLTDAANDYLEKSGRQRLQALAKKLIES